MSLCVCVLFLFADSDLYAGRWPLLSGVFASEPGAYLRAGETLHLKTFGLLGCYPSPWAIGGGDVPPGLRAARPATRRHCRVQSSSVESGRCSPQTAQKPMLLPLSRRCFSEEQQYLDNERPAGDAGGRRRPPRKISAGLQRSTITNGGGRFPSSSRRSVAAAGSSLGLAPAPITFNYTRGAYAALMFGDRRNSRRQMFRICFFFTGKISSAAVIHARPQETRRSVRPTLKISATLPRNGEMIGGTGGTLGEP